MGITRIQCSLVCMQAGVKRKQRRVDIHKPSCEPGDKARRQNTHEAGQNDQIGGLALEHAGEIRVECLAALIGLMVNQRCLDRSLSGDIQPASPRPVADDNADLAAQRARLAGREYRLEVGASSG